MKSGGKSHHAWPWLVLMFVLCANAKAQDSAADPGKCPSLPADTGLHWEYRAGPDSDFCRALRDDNSEAFGLYIASKSPFAPKRSDRAESGTIDGKAMHWYRGELAGQPNVQVRETLIELGAGKVAHIWMQAQSPEQLKEVLGQTEGLQFPSTRLSRAE